MSAAGGLFFSQRLFISACRHDDCITAAKHCQNMNECERKKELHDFSTRFSYHYTRNKYIAHRYNFARLV